MRSFLAVLVGIIAALAVQTGIDVLANQFYPAAITDMWDRRQVSEAFASRPMGALLFGIGGNFVAALLAGWLGKKIGGRGWTAWVPGLVLALMALLVAFSFPLPTWAALGMMVAPLIGALLANHLVPTREDAEPEPAPAADADA